MALHIVYLSIGSNKGEKKQNLDNAIQLLGRNNKIQVMKISRFYQTRPQNFTDQDWFVNGALKIETSLGPEPLLAELKKLEKKLDPDGKQFRFGPRIIDLDIIYFDDLILETSFLQIPHPRMHERCFVLFPLCDIGKAEIHPVLKQNAGELLKIIEKDEAQEVILLDEEA